MKAASWSYYGPRKVMGPFQNHTSLVNISGLLYRHGLEVLQVRIASRCILEVNITLCHIDPRWRPLPLPPTFSGVDHRSEIGIPHMVWKNGCKKNGIIRSSDDLLHHTNSRLLVILFVNITLHSFLRKPPCPVFCLSRASSCGFLVYRH